MVATCPFLYDTFLLKKGKGLELVIYASLKLKAVDTIGNYLK